MTLQHFDHYLRFSFIVLMSLLLAVALLGHVIGIESVSAQQHNMKEIEVLRSSLS